MLILYATQLVPVIYQGIDEGFWLTIVVLKHDENRFICAITHIKHGVTLYSQTRVLQVAETFRPITLFIYFFFQTTKATHFSCFQILSLSNKIYLLFLSSFSILRSATLASPTPVLTPVQISILILYHSSTHTNYLYIIFYSISINFFF